MEQHNKGFTLVELLVVISVTGLLMGILLPVLAAAREQARCAVCQSNLRSIGFGLRIYIGDYDGKMPSADPYPGSYGQKSQHWFMNSVLMRNLGIKILKGESGELIGPEGKNSVLVCPSHRNPDVTRNMSPDYPAEKREYELSYMANGTLGVSGKALVARKYRYESEYRKPSEAMMFCDGNGTRQTPGTVLYDGCPKANFEYRHRSRVNVLFLDQHLEVLEEKDIPFCTRFDDRRFGSFWYAKQE